MFQPNGSTIECDTCVAANTSACGDCIVNYVLANDAGPIEYVPAPERGAEAVAQTVAEPVAEPVAVQPRTGTIDAAIDLFIRAGLVDDPITFVTVAEFESGILQPPAELVLRR